MKCIPAELQMVMFNSCATCVEVNKIWLWESKSKEEIGVPGFCRLLYSHLTHNIDFEKSKIYRLAKVYKSI